MSFGGFTIKCFWIMMVALSIVPLHANVGSSPLTVTDAAQHQLQFTTKPQRAPTMSL